RPQNDRGRPWTYPITGRVYRVYLIHEELRLRQAEQAAAIRHFLDVVTCGRSKPLIEVRILDIPGKGKPHNASGYYHDLDKAAADVAAWERADRGGGIYVLLNEPDPAVYARSPDRLTEYLDITTSDKDILRRGWLFVDCDPERPKGVGSTDAQLADAVSVADQLKWWLREEFAWPDPVEGLSGNGRYLIYPIDLANDETSKDLLSAS